MSRRTQAGYEAGEVASDAEYLAAIALAGVDVLYVITGRAGLAGPPGGGEATPVGWDETSMSGEEARLVDSFRQMPPSDRAALQRLARSLADRARNGG